MIPPSLPISVMAQSSSSLSNAGTNFLENAAQSGHAEIDGNDLVD
jgi:hypothetical protein